MFLVILINVQSIDIANHYIWIIRIKHYTTISYFITVKVIKYRDIDLDWIV